MEKPTIKHWSEDDRPREKLFRLGRHNLANAELIALLIRTGSGSETAMDLAYKILYHCNNDLHKLSRLNANELGRFKGMGATKAACILAALELGKRSISSIPKNIERITSSSEASSLLFSHLSDLPHEEFWLLLLDRSNNIISKIQLSKGGVSGTLVDPKLVFKSAVDNLASGIILFHNHPSGNLKPSESDIKLTTKLKNAGSVLEIAVLDHIIISSKGYFSFADEGIM